VSNKNAEHSGSENIRKQSAGLAMIHVATGAAEIQTLQNPSLVPSPYSKTD
jgi:hypothetical protein